MESNSIISRTKKDVKIRPVIIPSLYKNGTHAYKSDINNPQNKLNTQTSKKVINEHNSKRIKKDQAIIKPYSGIGLNNKSEVIQGFGTLYTNVTNKSRLQIPHNRSGVDKGVAYKQMKTNVVGNINSLDLLFPLIVKRVSFQVANKNKQKATQQAQKDFPGLPRTALLLPFLKDAPIFIPSPAYKEITHPDIDIIALIELSRAEIARTSRKLVYEIYEVSPYTKNNVDYESFLAYNSEATLIDATWECYPLVCIGKGGPIRYFTGKARYQEDLIPYYLPESLEDTTLVFESRFESGNLRRAVQV